MIKNDTTDFKIIVGWITKILSGFIGLYLLINLISGLIMISNPDSLAYLGYDNQEQIDRIKETQYDVIKMWIVAIIFLLSLFLASNRLINNKKYGLILYNILTNILALGLIIGVIFVWSDMQSNAMFDSGIPYDVNPNKLTVILRGLFVLTISGLIIMTNSKLIKKHRIQKATTAQHTV